MTVTEDGHSHEAEAAALLATRRADTATLRRLAAEAEIVLSRYTLPRRIERVPEHLRCQAYAINPDR